MSGPAPHPVVAVAAVVFDRAGRGLWTVPGGKLHHGETLADAIVREVREETGLDVHAGPLAAVVERIVDGYHYVILDHVATLVDDDATPTAGDDARDARFVDAVELAALPTTDGLVPVIEQARVVSRDKPSG